MLVFRLWDGSPKCFASYECWFQKFGHVWSYNLTTLPVFRRVLVYSYLLLFRSPRRNPPVDLMVTFWLKWSDLSVEMVRIGKILLATMNINQVNLGLCVKQRSEMQNASANALHAGIFVLQFTNMLSTVSVRIYNYLERQVGLRGTGRPIYNTGISFWKTWFCRA